MLWLWNDPPQVQPNQEVEILKIPVSEKLGGMIGMFFKTETVKNLSTFIYSKFDQG